MKKNFTVAFVAFLLLASMSLKAQLSQAYYSKASGDLHNLSTWGPYSDGSGTPPDDFGPDKFFNLENRGSDYYLTGDWTLQGHLKIPFTSRLHINGFSLTIAIMDEDNGFLAGSTTSNLTVSTLKPGASYLHFYPGMNQLNNLTIIRNGGRENRVEVLIMYIEIYNTLNVVSGVLYSPPPVAFILRSTATNTARVTPVGGVLETNFYVERFIPARRAWRILSAPTSTEFGSTRTSTINYAWQEGSNNTFWLSDPHPGYGTHITGGSAADGFDQNPGAGYSIKYYNNATDTWNNQLNTNATPISGTAWMLFVRGNRSFPLGSNTVPPASTVLRSFGTLNTGDQVFNINATGFTAVPNPFASPVNFITMTKSNVQNSFWVWDPKMGGPNGVGAYVNISFNGTSWDLTPASVSPESMIIQNGQGFLVKTTSPAPGQLTIKESDKTLTPNMDVFRTQGNPSGLRINLQEMNYDGTASVLDEVFSSYSSNFSEKIDDMDASKLANIQENLAIVHDDQLLMVERRPSLHQNDEIEMKLWNTKQQAYILQFNPQNLSTTIPAWLVDNYLETVTEVPLDKISNFDFSINNDGSSGASDRFKVVLSSKKPELLNNLFTQSIRVYPNPVEGRNINLQFLNTPAGRYQLKVVNSLGQVVYKKNIDHRAGINSEKLLLDESISKGVYQLQIGNEKTKASFKLLIH
jgi:hypothetical protein